MKVFKGKIKSFKKFTVSASHLSDFAHHNYLGCPKF
jgi:hypothetical protein